MSTSAVARGARTSIPADGLQGLRENWRTDLGAGLLVSLIALPLCLGIAMASGFPAFGGIVTAIIGGLIVGPLCGSSLTIKGPAAGLIAIVIASVETLGAGNNADGYRFTLAAIVVASAIQIIFAILKLGRFVDFFPVSVVHGMLAAIGVIIFSKQIHPLLGVKPIAREPLELLLEIPHSIVKMNPEIALVGVTSVLIVIFAALVFGRLSRFFPGPLVAVAAGIALCLYFDFKHPHNYQWYGDTYSVEPKYLVTLPETFFAGITLPDFSKIATLASAQFIMLFALIGSLEALLTDKAIDSLDPAGRTANMNKDLLAIGAGNLLCGFIGGLPMISEVVRSSANISYGAKTRWANFFHGACLLVYVILLAPVISLIPNAALAGVLCVVGYRLASPKHFKECREAGKEQLFVFVVTIIATLLTDLLLGVFIGLLTEYAVCVLLGAPPSSMLCAVKAGTLDPQGRYVIKLPKASTFSNVISFKKALAAAQTRPVVIDFSDVAYCDHTFIQTIRYAEVEHRACLVGFEALAPLGHHRDSARRSMKSPSRHVLA
jgi:MFS superfamily sulfate permease-like transporter